jgi:organic hydroperoxide reductase OsmC/OhrA
MRIAAHVTNRKEAHSVSLETDGLTRALEVPPKSGGFGSSANGGELLCLALATCFCNDIYREAAKRGIVVSRVDVEARAEFGSPGEAARSLHYRAQVHGHGTEQEIRELMLHTDRVAEIQNTLRKGTPVRFEIVGAFPDAHAP